jgi:heme-degrading monooxygenase HmoA
MQRRTYLKSILAAGAAAGIASAQKDLSKGIVLIVDMPVQAGREQEMLHNFHTIFKPAAEKQPGYIDVNIVKLRTTVQGSAPPSPMNYLFILRMESEEMRQKWINSATHKRVWPTVEKTLASKDYRVLLYDIV